MKPESGAVKLLLLAEAMLLAVVLVFGVANKVRATGTDLVQQQMAEEEHAAETQWQMSAVSEGEATEAAETEAVAEGDSELPAAEPELSDEVKEKLSAMTLAEKVAQMFLTTPESLTQNEQVNIAGAGTRGAINECPVGGLIYASTNYQGRTQMRDLVTNGQRMMHERMGVYLFLAARLQTDTEKLAVGISDNYNASTLVELFAAENLADAREDVDMPLLFPQNAAELTQDAAWVMLSAKHDAQAAGEADMPCALSAKCVETVRAAGYQGIILTDSLSDDRIAGSYPTGEAAVLAVQAGVDMVYCPANFPAAYQAVLAAVQAGELAEERIDASVGRILTKKYQMPEPAQEQQETAVEERQEVVPEENEAETVSDENGAEN